MTRLLAAMFYLCCVASITISAQTPGGPPATRPQAFVLEVSIVEMIGAQPEEIERIGGSRDVLTRLVNQGKAKLTASLHVRTRVGESFSARVGQRSPIQTSVLPVFRTEDGRGPGQPSSVLPQFQYEHTGLTVEGNSAPVGDSMFDIRLKIEMSALDTSTGRLSPTFTTRSLTNTVRMRQGETALPFGLIQQEPQPPTPANQSTAGSPDLYRGSFIVLLTAKPVQ